MSSNKVLVVGAGPVGLATACLLKQQGLDVLVVEQNKSPTVFSKAIGIHARTLESMHALSITEAMIDNGQPMFEFEITDGKTSILDSNFSNVDTPYNFVLGLPQSKTEQLLLERFNELGGQVQWETVVVDLIEEGDREVESKKAKVLVKDSANNQTMIEANWIVGADGSRSIMRELAGIDFPGGSYGNAFILGDIKIDWDGNKSKLQFFLSPYGYLLLIPMPSGMHRVIAQTDYRFEDFQGTDRPEATLDQLQAVVDKNGPGGIKLHSPEWVTCAPFYHRKAQEMIKGRVVLVGDACHLFSPLGAQGLNTGFQDACNLAWRLGLYERGLSNISLVEKYAEERKQIIDLMIKVTSSTNRYITALSPHKRFLRHVLSRVFNKTQKVKTELPALMSGIKQAYQTDGNGQLIKGTNLPLLGTRFPHTWIESIEGGYMPVSKLIHGKDFTLMCINQRLTEDVIERFNRMKKNSLLSLSFVNTVLVGREAVKDQKTKLSFINDRLGAITNLLGDAFEGMILIRPDGFVSFVQSSWEVESLSDHFESIGINIHRLSQIKVA